MWLKTYNGSAAIVTGRVNLDQISWFYVANGAGGVFGVTAASSPTSAGYTSFLVSAGYPYATAADAVAAIDDLILNGS